MEIVCSWAISNEIASVSNFSLCKLLLELFFPDPQQDLSLCLSQTPSPKTRSQTTSIREGQTWACVPGQ